MTAPLDRIALDELRAQVARMRDERDEARAAALSEAIDAVTAQQMRDADRLAGDPTGGHGSWCRRHGHCHASEADATHERVLRALRALDGGKP